MVEAENVCLPDKILRLQGSELENFFYTVRFPPLCVIGVIGNCLNLLVLLSSETRTRRSEATQRLVLSIFNFFFKVVGFPCSLIR